MKGLTQRQAEILDFIKSYLKEHGYSPSYREIQAHFNFSSLGTVYSHLNVLKRKGVIDYENYGKRSITPNTSKNDEKMLIEVELPFIGYISTESQIETFTHSQTLSVPNYLVHNAGNSYILRAKGNSMQEELIADGDLLLVEAKQSAIDGEIVIALINGHDLIVKRYFADGEYVKLKSYNPDIQSIVIKESSITIQAILVGVLRIIN